MSDATPSTPGRSSVLFALGQLTAEHKNLAEKLVDLPQRVADTILPRVLALETTQGDHGRRISALERRLWIASGGLTVLVFVIETWTHLPAPIHR